MRGELGIRYTPILIERTRPKKDARTLPQAPRRTGHPTRAATAGRRRAGWASATVALEQWASSSGSIRVLPTCGHPCGCCVLHTSEPRCSTCVALGETSLQRGPSWSLVVHSRSFGTCPRHELPTLDGWSAECPAGMAPQPSLGDEPPRETETQPLRQPGAFARELPRSDPLGQRVANRSLAARW